MQAAGGASLSGAGEDAADEVGSKRVDADHVLSEQVCGEDGDGEQPAAALPRRRVGLLLAVAATVWALDQTAKVTAVARLTGREPVELLNGLLTLRLIRNPGAAFGFAGGMTVFFTLIAVGVVVAILRVARQLRSAWWALALGLLLGGALGNLTDRLLRAPGALRGHVVDFLELPHWPVFNLADSAIVSASAVMVLLSLRGLQVDGRRSGDSRADP